MEFNKETFEKALKANKIVRYQQHFEAVVKSYLEIENQALRQPPVSGSLPSVDPLDDENSEIHKIGREIAEMSDEEFEANCKALEKMLKGSKGNDR